MLWHKTPKSFVTGCRGTCFNIFFVSVKTSVGLVPEKINGRHLLPAVCVGHGGKLYVRTEPCPEDASYRVLPGPLLSTPSAVAHWELWSSVSGRFGILLL